MELAFFPTPKFQLVVCNDRGEQQSSHEQESSGKSSEENGEDAQQAKWQRLHSMWKRRILSWLPTMAT
jgi:hypothetical protein